MKTDFYIGTGCEGNVTTTSSEIFGECSYNSFPSIDGENIVIKYYNDGVTDCDNSEVMSTHSRTCGKCYSDNATQLNSFTSALVLAVALVGIYLQ